MSTRQYDCAIVGGGLAGGLIALALNRARPSWRIALIEAGRTLGGHHRWSWFDSDLSPEGRELLAGFRKCEWDEGYDVVFPSHSRTLRTGYRSMASSDFHEGLVRELPEEAVMTSRRAAHIDATGVDLDDGSRIEARAVFDCRSFGSSSTMRGGWQVFMGRHMRLAEPHGLTRPVIMDARVEQLAPHGNGHAYRFVYVLPLASHEVFVEDTYYADDPLLDRSALSGRIDAYVREQGWKEEAIIGHETGVLPVLTGGDFSAYRREVATPGVALAGARGGFVHPLTSYTLPMAVDNALVAAREADLTGVQLAALFEARSRSHWRRTRYYRMLTRMMFLAASPDKRVRVFEHFYRLREPLVERFYSGRSSLFDRLRILVGKPPVPIPHAISAIFGRGRPLEQQKPSERS